MVMPFEKLISALSFKKKLFIFYFSFVVKHLNGGDHSQSVPKYYLVIYMGKKTPLI